MEINFNAKTRLQGQRGSLVIVLELFPHLLAKIQNSFYECVEEECSVSLPIPREKQIWNPFHLTWS